MPAFLTRNGKVYADAAEIKAGQLLEASGFQGDVLVVVPHAGTQPVVGVANEDAAPGELFTMSVEEGLTFSYAESLPADGKLIYLPPGTYRMTIGVMAMRDSFARLGDAMLNAAGSLMAWMNIPAVRWELLQVDLSHYPIYRQLYIHRRRKMNPRPRVHLKRSE